MKKTAKILVILLTLTLLVGVLAICSSAATGTFTVTYEGTLDADKYPQKDGYLLDASGNKTDKAPAAGGTVNKDTFYSAWRSAGVWGGDAPKGEMTITLNDNYTQTAGANSTEWTQEGIGWNRSMSMIVDLNNKSLTFDGSPYQKNSTTAYDPHIMMNYSYGYDEATYPDAIRTTLTFKNGTINLKNLKTSLISFRNGKKMDIVFENVKIVVDSSCAGDFGLVQAGNWNAQNMDDVDIIFKNCEVDASAVTSTSLAIVKLEYGNHVDLTVENSTFKTGAGRGIQDGKLGGTSAELRNSTVLVKNSTLEGTGDVFFSANASDTYNESAKPVVITLTDSTVKGKIRTGRASYVFCGGYYDCTFGGGGQKDGYSSTTFAKSATSDPDVLNSAFPTFKTNPSTATALKFTNVSSGSFIETSRGICWVPANDPDFKLAFTVTYEGTLNADKYPQKDGELLDGAGNKTGKAPAAGGTVNKDSFYSAWRSAGIWSSDTPKGEMTITLNGNYTQTAGADSTEWAQEPAGWNRAMSMTVDLNGKVLTFQGSPYQKNSTTAYDPLIQMSYSYGFDEASYPDAIRTTLTFKNGTINLKDLKNSLIQFQNGPKMDIVFENVTIVVDASCAGDFGLIQSGSWNTQNTDDVNIIFKNTTVDASAVTSTSLAIVKLERGNHVDLTVEDSTFKTGAGRGIQDGKLGGASHELRNSTVLVKNSTIEGTGDVFFSANASDTYNESLKPVVITLTDSTVRGNIRAGRASYVFCGGYYDCTYNGGSQKDGYSSTTFAKSSSADPNVSNSAYPTFKADPSAVTALIFTNISSGSFVETSRGFCWVPANDPDFKLAFTVTYEGTLDTTKYPQQDGYLLDASGNKTDKTPAAGGTVNKDTFYSAWRSAGIWSSDTPKGEITIKLNGNYTQTAGADSTEWAQESIGWGRAMSMTVDLDGNALTFDNSPYQKNSTTAYDPLIMMNYSYGYDEAIYPDAIRTTLTFKNGTINLKNLKTSLISFRNGKKMDIVFENVTIVVDASCAGDFGLIQSGSWNAQNLDDINIIFKNSTVDASAVTSTSLAIVKLERGNHVDLTVEDSTFKTGAGRGIQDGKLGGASAELRNSTVLVKNSTLEGTGDVFFSANASDTYNESLKPVVIALTDSTVRGNIRAGRASYVFSGGYYDCTYNGGSQKDGYSSTTFAKSETSDPNVAFSAYPAFGKDPSTYTSIIFTNLADGEFTETDRGLTWIPLSEVVTVSFTLDGRVICERDVRPGAAVSETGVTLRDGMYKIKNVNLFANVLDKDIDVELNVDAENVVLDVDGLNYNLSLANDMSINLAIPAKYVGEGLIESITIDIDGVEVPIAGEYLMIDGESYYVVTKDGINVKMATVAYDFTVTEGTYNKNEVITLSATGYAKTLLETAESKVEAELARSILAYVLEAERYFEKTNPTEEDLARIADLEAALLGTAAPDMKDSFGESLNIDGFAETPLAGAYINLNGDTPAFVIELDKVEGLEAVVTVSYVNYLEETITETFELNQANRTAAILGMKICDFDNMLTIEVNGISNEFNLVTYLNWFAGYGNSEEAVAKSQAFANAIWNYVVAANGYKGFVVEK